MNVFSIEFPFYFDYIPVFSILQIFTIRYGYTRNIVTSYIIYFIYTICHFILYTILLCPFSNTCLSPFFRSKKRKYLFDLFILFDIPCYYERLHESITIIHIIRNWCTAITILFVFLYKMPYCSRILWLHI